MLDLNMPKLTDAGARELAEGARGLAAAALNIAAGARAFGAESTANLLLAVDRTDKLLDRADALLARVYDKRMVFVPLGILGAFVAYRIAVGLHREFGAKPAVKHSAPQRDRRAEGGR
jgi:hypothetical protein